MDGMRQLGKRRRLQADSDIEVVRSFNRCALDLEGDLQFNGRLLKPGPLLNALALWWVSRPEAERRDIAQDGLSRLEAVLGETQEPAPTQQTAITVELTREASPKRGRKKSG
jgi:hypothetical protein